MSKRLTHHILIGSTLLFALSALPALAQERSTGATRGNDATSPFQTVASKHGRHYRHGNHHRYGGRHDLRRGRWIPGHWRWAGNRRVWVEGRWVQGPPRGYGRPPQHRYQGYHHRPQRPWAPPPQRRPWHRN